MKTKKKILLTVLMLVFTVYKGYREWFGIAWR